MFKLLHDVIQVQNCIIIYLYNQNILDGQRNNFNGAATWMSPKENKALPRHEMYGRKGNL